MYTNIFFIHLRFDIDIHVPPLTANGHGYWNPKDLSEQLPSYALFEQLSLTIHQCIFWFSTKWGINKRLGL